jgi:hypothetical protein
MRPRRRRWRADRATPRSSRPHPLGTSDASAVMSRTQGSPPPLARRATRRKQPAPTRPSRADARRATFPMVRAALPPRPAARLATRRPRCRRFTRPRAMLSSLARAATRRLTRCRWRIEWRAPAHVTPTSAITSRTRPAAQGATYSESDASRSAVCAICQVPSETVERPSSSGRSTFPHGLKRRAANGSYVRSVRAGAMVLERQDRLLDLPRRR